MVLTSYLHITITLLLLFSSTYSAQVQSWAISCDTELDDEFTKYYDEPTESPIMCFKFKNLHPSDNRNKYYFSTQVDKYTLVQLVGSNLGEEPDANATQWSTTANSYVSFEAGNYSSPDMYLRYFDSDANQWWVYSQLTAVVILTDGYVDEIVWDEGCYSCGDENCINKNCAIPLEDCNGNCDFSAYISWYGTDTAGQYLLSSGERLSQFQSVSAKSYYDYVSDNFDTSDLEF